MIRSRLSIKILFIATLLLSLSSIFFLVDAQPPTYQQLYWDSIPNIDLTEGFSPRFICQNCQQDFFQNKTIVAELPPTFNFNGLVTFQCPHCGARYELYVAVHHDYENGTFIRIQRSDAEGAAGISPNWWVIDEPQP